MLIIFRLTCSMKPFSLVAFFVWMLGRYEASLDDNTQRSNSSTNKSIIMQNTRPTYIRNDFRWFELMMLQDLYDACYNANVREISSLLSKLTIRGFYEKSIQIAIEGSAESDEMRWTAIYYICKFANSNGGRINLRHIASASSVDAIHLANLLNLSNSENCLDSHQAGVKAIKVSSTLKNCKSSNENGSDLTEAHTTLTSPVFQDRFISSQTVLKAPVKHLIKTHNQVEALPNFEENAQFNGKEEKEFVDLVYKIQDPEMIEEMRNFTLDSNGQIEILVKWILEKPKEIVYALITSNFETVEFVLHVVGKAFKSSKECALFITCLQSGLKTIGLHNKDYRVFPLVLIMLQDASQSNNTEDRSYLSASQYYINHVVVFKREKEELMQRVRQIIELGSDLLELVFDGVAHMDPILLAIFNRRWHLIDVLLGCLNEGKKILIKFSDEKKSFSFTKFLQNLIVMPWTLYEKLASHYTMPHLEDESLFDIWNLATYDSKLDRRVLTAILGPPRQFGSAEIKWATFSNQTEKFLASHLKFK